MHLKRFGLDKLPAQLWQYNNVSFHLICHQYSRIMQVSYNTNDEFLAPKSFDNQLATYFFFTSYIYVGTLFFLGIFISVLFINFKENNDKLINHNLTKQQSEFKTISEQILKELPQYSSPPNNIFRLACS